MMKKLIVSILMILALGAGSLFAQNANTGNKKAGTRPRTTKAKGNANAATSGGSTGTSGGTEAGGETKKSSGKKKHKKHRKHAKKA